MDYNSFCLHQVNNSLVPSCVLHNKIFPNSWAFTLLKIPLKFLASYRSQSIVFSIAVLLLESETADLCDAITKESLPVLKEQTKNPKKHNQPNSKDMMAM